jgi:Na+-driven multidrug efflux pump
MADRIFTALSQIGNNVLVLPRVPHVARSLLAVGTDLTVKRETRRVFLAAVGLSVIAALPVAWYVFDARDEPSAAVAEWALLLVASLPAAVAGTLGTRLIVATGKAKLIPLFAVGGITVNLVGNIVGVALLGATGVVLSTLVCRYVLLFATVVGILRFHTDDTGLPHHRQPIS